MHGVGCTYGHLHWARTGGYDPGHLELGCVEANSTLAIVCTEILASRLFAFHRGRMYGILRIRANEKHAV